MEKKLLQKKLFLLNKELSKSFLSNLDLEDENDIIHDYYLYYVLKNEMLKREINDGEKLCDLFEIICNFQFELNLNKK